jgi:hypothetical protein
MPPAQTNPRIDESVDGQDLFVETDCAAGTCTASCGPGGSGCEPHLMIRRKACEGAGGPWWDTDTKACRLP